MLSNNQQLVAKLVKEGVLRNNRVREAIMMIDRKDFVSPELTELAYEDIPLSIGHGQTISQPYTVMFMLELLGVMPGERVLDVGSGSGWTAALLGYLVGPGGAVYGTEIIPELVQFGQNNLSWYEMTWVHIEKAVKEVGLPSKAPFDRILVSAAAHDLPKSLTTQLQSGGTMVLPVCEEIWQIHKESEMEMKIQKFKGFSFVPLHYKDS